MQFFLIALALSAASAAPLARRNLDVAINPDALANGLETELVQLDARTLSSIFEGEGELPGRIGTTVPSTSSGVHPLEEILPRQDDTSDYVNNAESAVTEAEMEMDNATPANSPVAPIEGAITDVTTGVNNGVNAAMDPNLPNNDEQAAENVMGGLQLAGQTLENGSA